MDLKTIVDQATDVSAIALEVPNMWVYVFRVGNTICEFELKARTDLIGFNEVTQKAEFHTRFTYCLKADKERISYGDVGPDPKAMRAACILEMKSEEGRLDRSRKAHEALEASLKKVQP